jgi:4-amino-4-deoxy-L-arabinose transferase-like glycosyltransferase
MKRYHFVLSLLAGVFLCLFWAPIWAQPQYQKTDLDALLGAGLPQTKEKSVAVAVNDVGHAVGHYTVKVEDRAIPKKI